MKTEKPMKLDSTKMTVLYANSKLLTESRTVSELLLGATLYTAIDLAAKFKCAGAFDIAMDMRELRHLAGLSDKRNCTHSSFSRLADSMGLTYTWSRYGVVVHGNMSDVADSPFYGGSISTGHEFDIALSKNVLERVPGRPGVLYCFIRSRALSRTKDRRIKSRDYILGCMPHLVSKHTFPPALKVLTDLGAVVVGRCRYNSKDVECFTPHRIFDSTKRVHQLKRGRIEAAELPVPAPEPAHEETAKSGHLSMNTTW